MEALDRLENIKLKAEELHTKGLIKDVTKRFFSEVCESLSFEMRYHSEYRNEWIIQSIASEIYELDLVLSVIENKVDIKTHKEFFTEMILKLRNYDELDLWVIKMPLNFPGCRIFSEGDNLCFILQIPEKPNYLDINLLGLLAHEPAHIHNIVSSKVDSLNEIKRKVGEALADVLAYSIVEYMFTHSSVFLVREIIGVSKANRSRGAHPSWLARITVLSNITNEIWDSTEIIRRNSVNFDQLLSILPSPSISEELLIQEILREARAWKTEWIKYKTDENLLGRLEQLSEDETDKIGEIPKKIRELIVRCTN